MTLNIVPGFVIGNLQDHTIKELFNNLGLKVYFETYIKNEKPIEIAKLAIPELSEPIPKHIYFMSKNYAGNGNDIYTFIAVDDDKLIIVHGVQK